GRGADQLTGGGGDDILIGGATLYDANQAALDAILAEWTSAATYVTRIRHLMGTAAGGLNGAVRLDARTVGGDGGADVLTGAGGLDWFLVGPSGTVKDRNVGGSEGVTAAG